MTAAARWILGRYTQSPPRRPGCAGSSVVSGPHLELTAGAGGVALHPVTVASAAAATAPAWAYHAVTFAAAHTVREA